jgi:hypothetical protein
MTVDQASGYILKMEAVKPDAGRRGRGQQRMPVLNRMRK